MDDTPSIKTVCVVVFLISLITCGVAFTLLSTHFDFLSLKDQLTKQISNHLCEYALCYRHWH